MKKFILKVLLFFACVVVMDFVFDQFFSYLRIHAKGGSTANCEYIANRASEDIIILGSSRAAHHYVPQIIEDSLGLSCYNCGEEGNGVVLAYGRLKMLINRYKPKLVIYEVTPGYDYEKTEPNSKYLGYLRQYYNKDGISEIFEDFDDSWYWLKMKSKMYQNTGRILPNCLDNIVYRDNRKGYDALYGHMNKSAMLDSKKTDIRVEIDSLKLSYYDKFLALCQTKGITVLFFISPRYTAEDNIDIYEPAVNRCKLHSVPLLNFSCCPSISNNIVFFQDKGHMNDEGATEYTKMVVNYIKRYIK